MKKELILGTMLVMLSIAMVQQAACDLSLDKQLSLPQKFRILAVEGYWRGGAPVRSAEYFTRALTHFSNWNNMTFPSYIQLLSWSYNETEIIDGCREFYAGNATKFNVQRLINNFLGQASADELAVFYIITDGLPSTLFLDETINSTELQSWLGTLQCTVCVIIDACYSGSWINDGAGTTFGQNKTVLCSSLSNQLSWGYTEPYLGGEFTGYESHRYRNGTFLPVGLIGATIAAEDMDDDGWLSVMECFAYAQPSVQQLDPEDSKYHQDPVSFNGLPDNFDPPLVQLPVATHDIAITSISPYRTIVSNRTMTSINVTIANQGDVQETFTIIASYNSTTFASQMITVGNGSSVKWLVIWNTTGVAIGNFTITAMVNQLPGETDIADNSNSSLIQVSIQGDINSDGKVDMKDVSYVARRFMRLPSDPSWDPNADINEDQKIDMKDISTVAKRFGEHYP